MDYLEVITFVLSKDHSSIQFNSIWSSIGNKDKIINNNNVNIACRHSFGLLLGHVF